MKKKKNIFLILSVIISFYIVFSIILLVSLKNEELGNIIVGLLMLMIFIYLEYICIKKYRFYKNNMNQDIDHIYLKPDDSSNVKLKKRFKPIYVVLAFVVILSLGFFMAIQTNGPDGMVSNLKDAGMNDVQSKNSLEVLKNCDITNALDVEIKHDELLDNAHFEGEKGYRIKYGDVNNIVLYLKGDEVYNVRWADKDLYKDKEVFSKITDYMLTEKDKSDLQLQGQEYVKTALKSPSSSKFPNITEWAFSKDKDEIIVQSYVDAQNSFGAMMRSEFQITLTPDKKTVTSFILDGKEYIE